MIKKKTTWIAALCAVVVGLLQAGEGPEAVVETSAERLPHPIAFHPADSLALDSVRNVITDPAGSLTPFYERLARLQTADSQADTAFLVSILHLGDSHIQAGFLTGPVMRSFHRDFGNAGRGLISPLKLAKTNEPSDYAIRSAQTWDNARLTQSSPPFPVGPGGVAIAPRQADFSLTISTMDRDDPEAYRFNRVHVFKHPDAPDLSAEGGRADSTLYDQTILLPESVTEVTLSNSNTKLPRLVYCNFSLENGSNGILYHVAGINGAQYLHWMRVPELERQIEALDPQLVILSMGTNEARMGRSFDAGEFAAQIDALVARVREAVPNAAILLTTPPDSYLSRRVNRRTTYGPNPLLETVAAVIRDYAERNSLACWDLYEISGGKNSRGQWLSRGLYGRDRLHFTAEGYAVQGKSLYRALLAGYNQYVTNTLTTP